MCNKSVLFSLTDVLVLHAEELDDYGDCSSCSAHK